MGTTKKEKRAADAAAAWALLGMDAPDPAPAPKKSAPERLREAAKKLPNKPVPPAKPKLIPPGQASFEKELKTKRVAKDNLDWQVEANALAAQEGLAQVVSGPGNDVPEKHWPRKWEHGQLKRGMSVWYRGERWYVEFANVHWSKGVYVRICDKRVHPDLNVKSGSDLCYRDEKGNGHGHILSFCVHADLLKLAPTTGNLYTKQDSMSAVERKERAKAGIKDVGDPVAEMLRKAKDLDGVYAIAADYLGCQVQELKGKYAHLNPGQQRMNCGNKMRAKWKNENR